MRPFWGTNMLYLLLLGSPHSAIALPAQRQQQQLSSALDPASSNASGVGTEAQQRRIEALDAELQALDAALDEDRLNALSDVLQQWARWLGRTWVSVMSVRVCCRAAWWGGHDRRRPQYRTRK